MRTWCLKLFGVLCVNRAKRITTRRQARPERKRGDIYIYTISGMGFFFFSVILRQYQRVATVAWEGGRLLACFFFFAESPALLYQHHRNFTPETVGFSVTHLLASNG